ARSCGLLPPADDRASASSLHGLGPPARCLAVGGSVAHRSHASDPAAPTARPRVAGADTNGLATGHWRRRSGTALGGTGLASAPRPHRIDGGKSRFARGRVRDDLTTVLVRPVARSRPLSRGSCDGPDRL